MRNLTTIFVVVLVVAGFGPAMADDISKQKAAENLIDLLGMDSFEAHFIPNNIKSKYDKSCYDDKLLSDSEEQARVSLRKDLTLDLVSKYDETKLTQMNSFFSTTEMGKYLSKYMFSGKVEEAQKQIANLERGNAMEETNKFFQSNKLPSDKESIKSFYTEPVFFIKEFNNKKGLKLMDEFIKADSSKLKCTKLNTNNQSN